MSADTPVRGQGCPQTGVSADRGVCRQGAMISKSTLILCSFPPLPDGWKPKKTTKPKCFYSTGNKYQVIVVRMKTIYHFHVIILLKLMIKSFIKRGSLLHAPLYQLSCESRDGVSCSYRKRL